MTSAGRRNGSARHHAATLPLASGRGISRRSASSWPSSSHSTRPSAWVRRRRINGAGSSIREPESWLPAIITMVSLGFCSWALMMKSYRRSWALSGGLTVSKISPAINSTSGCWAAIWRSSHSRKQACSKSRSWPWRFWPRCQSEVWNRRKANSVEEKRMNGRRKQSRAIKLESLPVNTLLPGALGTDR